MNSMQYAGQYHTMDPQTEDLLANGRKLKNGMVVLIEDEFIKVDPTSINENSRPYEKNKLQENNRWCEVSEVEINDRYENDTVSFVAIYADGTKRKRTFGCGYGWFVKLDSLPPEKVEPAPLGNLVEYAEADAEATMQLFDGFDDVIEYGVQYPSGGVMKYGPGYKALTRAKNEVDKALESVSSVKLVKHVVGPWVEVSSREVENAALMTEQK